MPIMFNMVLKAEGVDPRDVRLVRHHDTRSECKISPYGLWKRDPALLERYQSIQSNEVFKVGNTLASFVRTPGGQTLFVGLYRVDGKGVSDVPAPDASMPPVEQRASLWAQYVLYVLLFVTTLLGWAGTNAYGRSGQHLRSLRI